MLPRPVLPIGPRRRRIVVAVSDRRDIAFDVTRSPAETPLMRQYLDIKERHPDAIVFFRLGDFYEMFFEDAVIGARLLDLTLTTRDKGKDDAVPMCGVPHHAARVYIAKLTELGHKVVLCEQTEDPKLAKGLVKREVVRIITPGVVLDDDVLEPKLPRYLAALVPGKDTIGLAYLDATTGELCATELAVNAVVDELVRVAPREVLAQASHLNDTGPLAAIRARYRASWNPAAVPSDAGAKAELGPIAAGHSDGDGDGSTGKSSTAHSLALRAAATVVAYARATQPTGALPIVRLQYYEPSDAVVLDEAAIANLELTETLIGKRKDGSLLDVIDETATAPGGRLLRRWLLYPLIDVAQIRRRQDAVAWLVERPALCDAIRRALSRIADLERLAGKATLGVATPRDLGRLRDALASLPELIDLVRSGRDPLGELPALLDHASGLAACAHPALPALVQRLAAALVDEPPSLQKDGHVIRAGYDATVDEARRLADGGKDEILAIEEREQKQSGIGSLKVRYNRVFGYYIEVTKPNLHLVPKDYERRQTTVGGERFATPELKEFEEKVLTAEERRFGIEERLFEELRGKVADEATRIRGAADAVASADVLLSLARVAAERGYVRPQVEDSEVLEIEDGRHPVVEALLEGGPAAFVPNDVVVASRAAPECERHGAVLVVTGPNMAGKSTVMRQAALVVLLAQLGSFVPARRARVGIVDRIFTRVGAADDLARGRSTFMVEMTETSAILHNATRRSLVVLDEIGRGTSTFDGVSIAWAVAEHLHDAVGCRTLFATHYHELQDLARERPAVRNLTVAVREVGDQVVFLRKLVQGGASRSYGIEVAKLAGLPAGVLTRAREILRNLEAMEVDEGGHAALARGRRRKGPGTSQLGLFAGASPADPAAEEVAKALRALDVDALRPLDALNLLAGWKKKLGDGE
jgi:DNA mismatch repair protein MutS